MSSKYDAFKQSHRLLFALVEMKEMERVLVDYCIEHCQRADFPPAKKLFARWAQESKNHSEALQQMVEEFQGKPLYTDCKTCMEDAYAASYSRERMLELLSIGNGTIGIKELYASFKMHLVIESDAERRYARMAEMTTEEKIKRMLMKLSEDEKKHHEEAQLFVETMEKEYSEIIKNFHKS